MAVTGIPLHEGELKLRRLLHSPEDTNYTTPYLTPDRARFLQTAPLLAISTLDAQNRPWTSVWGGERGFACSLGSSMLGLKTLVDAKFDPVVEALLGHGSEGERGKTLSALPIDLEARRRVKLAGTVVAGAKTVPDEGMDGVGEVQLVIRVDSSLGNCPKYLNRKAIRPALPKPQLVSTTLPLPPAAVSLLATTDLFFISTTFAASLSTNYRGGPPGFVRLISNTPSSVRVAYPEYSGNRLYQTLGNLAMAPEAGIVVPDFDNGDVLYMTAKAEILIGSDAADLIPRSNPAIALTILEARFVRGGLAFRGERGEFSPYNPKVRPLRTEKGALLSSEPQTTTTAKLLAKDVLTPTIAKLRFAICEPTRTEPTMRRWKAGQHVALSFAQDFDLGYSHMRDDDPRSLNDDYTRTFTVSSPPGSLASADEFELTIRNVGTVTDFLFWSDVRRGLEVPLMGFGGEFAIEMGGGSGGNDEGGIVVPFVAGGIGITPVLGQVGGMDWRRFRLLWAVAARDLGLVRDVFARVPELARVARVFVTGVEDGGGEDFEGVLEGLEGSGAKVRRGRIGEEDVAQSGIEAERWYVCAGKSLRQSVVAWLPGKEVVFEDFDY